MNFFAPLNKSNCKRFSFFSFRLMIPDSQLGSFTSATVSCHANKHELTSITVDHFTTNLNANTNTDRHRQPPEQGEYYVTLQLKQILFPFRRTIHTSGKKYIYLSIFFGSKTPTTNAFVCISIAIIYLQL
jgi:hypothetical protein